MRSPGGRLQDIERILSSGFQRRVRPGDGQEEQTTDEQLRCGVWPDELHSQPER